MEGRLGRVLGRDSGSAGVGSHKVYPPSLLTVVGERCSAGGVISDGLGCGRSSGCGWAGSFVLLSCEKKVNAFSRFLKTCRFFSATERFFCVFVNSIIYLFR